MSWMAIKVFWLINCKWTYTQSGPKEVHLLQEWWFWFGHCLYCGGWSTILSYSKTVYCSRHFPWIYKFRLLLYKSQSPHGQALSLGIPHFLNRKLVFSLNFPPQSDGSLFHLWISACIEFHVLPMDPVSLFLYCQWNGWTVGRLLLKGCYLILPCLLKPFGIFPILIWFHHNCLQSGIPHHLWFRQ